MKQKNRTDLPVRFLILCCGFGFQCVFLTAVDDKFTEQEFQHEIAEHRDGQNQEVIDAATLSQISKEGGEGRKDQIEAKDLGHGYRHIGSRFERVPPVQGEVPENRENQRDQIGNPVVLHEEFQQSKGTDLNDAGRGGKQGEFHGLPEGFFLLVHGVPFGNQNS